MSDKRKEEPAASNEAVPCSNSQSYTIKPGDTMFLIAKRFNVSLSSLRDCNPQITDPNVIYPGQVIIVPTLGTAPATRIQPMPAEPMPGAPCPPGGSRRGPLPPNPLPRATCPNGQIYRVVCGDTMFKIAQRFDVSLDALVRANPQITDPNLIYPGQEICIPGAGGVTACPSGNTYTVKPGDTLFNIARQHGIMLSDLIAVNPQIVDPDRIYPGQVICIPTAAAGTAPAELPGELPPPSPVPVAPPLPVERPVELPPPLVPRPCRRMEPPMGPLPMRPRPCPQPPVHPLPRPCPGGRHRPAMPLPAVPPPIQAPCGPITGEHPMYPMPVYVVVPWDECPYRPKEKCKKRKHGHKSHRHCCH